MRSNMNSWSNSKPNFSWIYSSISPINLASTIASNLFVTQTLKKILKMLIGWALSIRQVLCLQFVLSQIFVLNGNRNETAVFFTKLNQKGNFNAHIPISIPFC